MCIQSLFGMKAKRLRRATYLCDYPHNRARPECAEHREAPATIFSGCRLVGGKILLGAHAYHNGLIPIRLWLNHGCLHIYICHFAEIFLVVNGATKDLIVIG